MQIARNGAVLASLALFLSPALATAQAPLQIRVMFPAPPPLVVVEPGIQVVPDQDEEVFFVDGWYWLRHDHRWYRARDHRGGWVLVEVGAVPPELQRIPPGKYRHWRKEEEKAERREAHEAAKAEKEAWKAEKKAWKSEEKAEKKAWKEEKKHHKHDDDD